MDFSRLRRHLSRGFNESELRNLCFDLGVDYDDLPDNGTDDKARELIGYVKRHRMVVDMLTLIRERRSSDPYWAHAHDKALDYERKQDTGPFFPVVKKDGTGPLRDTLWIMSKQFERISTRLDRLDRMFLVALAVILVWLAVVSTLIVALAVLQ